jgi:hypothetical protein
MYDTTEDKEYLRIQNVITKTLNNRQQKILDDKYKLYYFLNASRIPKEYPIFALRNFFIDEFNVACPSDLHYIKTIERNTHISSKYIKHKYKNIKTDKHQYVIPTYKKYKRSYLSFPIREKSMKNQVNKSKSHLQGITIVNDFENEEFSDEFSEEFDNDFNEDFDEDLNEDFDEDLCRYE